jgi:hypothetical protein
VEYGLTPRAQELMPVLGALARWGYEWAWSPPRSGEAIDLGAIFRLTPGLITAQELNGKIGLTVQENGQQTFYTVTAVDGEITVSEREDGRPDAQIVGTPSAWVSALSPEQDRRSLQITGDAAVAERLIGALAGAAADAGAGAVAGAADAGAAAAADATAAA